MLRNDASPSTQEFKVCAPNSMLYCIDWMRDASTRERDKSALEDARDALLLSNANVYLGVGVLFGVFAITCGLLWLRGAPPTGAGIPLAALFSMVWVVGAIAMLRLGIRGRNRYATHRRLRSVGRQARGTIQRAHHGRTRTSGLTTVELSIRLEQPGVQAYEVKVVQAVRLPGRYQVGAVVDLLVDQQDPAVALVDERRG
jgi:hypothetical protein